MGILLRNGTKCKGIWLASLMLMISFLLPGFANAQEEEVVKGSVISEEQLQLLKDEGIVGYEVTLNDFIDQYVTVEDSIEEIKTSDRLKDYNLTINKNGDIVSTQDGNSLSAIAYTYPGTSIFAQPGDILITNNTFANGLLGHAGIVSSNPLQYASIRNNKSTPKIYSLSSWFTDYPNTKVIRINDRTKANAAGSWAANYVRTNPNADYDITLAINSLDPTYCSKIVWQAYAFTGNVVGTASVTIKAPYGFLKRSSYPGGVPKVIYTTGADFGSVDF